MDRIRGVKPGSRRSSASIVFNVLLTGVPVYMFHFTYLHFYRTATFYNKGNVLFSLLYCLLLALLMVVYSGYRIRQFRTRELVFSFALASTITNMLIYIVMCLISGRILRPWAVILTTFAQWIVETGLYVLARVVLPVMEPPVEALYIREDEDRNDLFLRKFDSRRSRYSVKTVVSADRPWEEIERALRANRTVLIGETSPALRQDIMDYCFRTGKEAILLPSVSDVMVGSASSFILGDALLFNLNTEGPDMGYLRAKRLFDIAASVLGLVILSPLMLATAIAVKRQDGGPVFYRQTRLTQGGREFQLTKFRSMIVNAEQDTGAVMAGKSDSRITKVGEFIRATRIDELPQLWNILKGDMSVVGPRPERPEFYEQICAEYPEFDYRLKVKAGLTGYAQLYGKYNTTFADKVKLDLYYIQHASFLWDLQLIFYTLKIIFIKESTEGVEQSGTQTEKTPEPRT
ncbi:MAG: sugar transferase [Oscillospiraceae bacterium]|nr:sugar transferase [Oscillospiraceae bacterium]